MIITWTTTLREFRCIYIQWIDCKQWPQNNTETSLSFQTDFPIVDVVHICNAPRHPMHKEAVVNLLYMRLYSPAIWITHAYLVRLANQS